MQVKLYETESGHNPVLNFLMSQQATSTDRLRRDIRHLEEQGMALLRTDKMKKLRGQDELYELRTRHQGAAYRILFTTIGGIVWLLHGFTKKSQQTPQKEINTAKERKRQLLIRLSTQAAGK